MGREIPTFLFKLGQGEIEVVFGFLVDVLFIKATIELGLTLIQQKPTLVIFCHKHIFHTRNILNGLISDHESLRGAGCNTIFSILLRFVLLI